MRRRSFTSRSPTSGSSSPRLLSVARRFHDQRRPKREHHQATRRSPGGRARSRTRRGRVRQRQFRAARRPPRRPVPPRRQRPAAPPRPGGTATTRPAAPPPRSRCPARSRAAARRSRCRTRTRPIAAFTKANSGTTVTYGGGGSGKGRTDLASQGRQLRRLGFALRRRRTSRPTRSSTSRSCSRPITVSYNLKGVDKLQLSADTIAKIFSAAGHERGTTRPSPPTTPASRCRSTNITVAHRSDGSGTTQNFTEYLVKAAPTTWTLKQRFDGRVAGRHPGRQRQPGRGPDHHAAPTAASATSTSPMRSRPSSIYASVKNSSGNYIEPSAESATAAGDGIDGEPRPHASRRPTRRPRRATRSRPRAGSSSIRPRTRARGRSSKAYLNYLVGDGQNLLPDLDYAPLSESLQQKAIAQLDQIKIG